MGIWDAEHRTNVKMIKVERGKVTREQRKCGMVGWDDDEKPMEGAKEKVSPHDTAASLGCTLPRVPAISVADRTTCRPGRWPSATMAR